MVHIKETTIATNQGGFSYTMLVFLMTFKQLSSLDCVAN